MKDRKKKRGMKAEIRAYKKRLRYIATVVTVAILVSIIALTSFLIYSYLKPSLNQTSSPSPTTQFKAAIIDHLSLTAPNQNFVQIATTILEDAEFTVDYYPGEEINVEFYRNLPTHGYILMVLRVHSAIGGTELGLFTAEPYSSTKHVQEQFYGKVGPVAYSIEDGERGNMYFGIAPNFVKSSMNGRFQNTIIIMMGCEGLTYTNMAEAFIEKGAKVYIGWNEGVSASHTDLATTHLLEHLITQKQTIKQAVTETMNEVGPDPVDGSILLYYPTTSEVEDYVIPEAKSTLTTNVAETNPKIEKLKDVA